LSRPDRLHPAKANCRYGHGQCTAGVRPETVLESLRTAMQFATRDIR
jgi:hypothetical protein